MSHPAQSLASSAVITYDGVVKNVDISNVFDGSASYWGITYTGTTEIVIELTLHKVFSWGNTLYIDFGPRSTKTVKVEVMRSDTTYPNDVWTEKFSTTTNMSDHVIATVTHTPVGASNSGGGFNKVRLTFSFANGAYSSTMFRIAQIGIVNYGSSGLRETYMSRGSDDPVFRNITPYASGTYSLGGSSSKWSAVYANDISATRFLNTMAFGTGGQGSISDTGIKVLDVRNASLTANVMSMAANFFFKMSDMPDASKWWSVLHVKGWSGAYSAWELAGPASNSDQRTTPLYVRSSDGSQSSNPWGSWRKILDGSMLDTSVSSTATDKVATPSAVKQAYDLAYTANGTANSALSGVNGTLIFDTTYSISNGIATFSAHVYCKGEEVTSNYADSNFSWWYRLGDSEQNVSMGTGKTKQVTITNLGYGGHVGCAFDDGN